MQSPPHLPPASTAGQDVIEPRLTGEAEMPAQSCLGVSALAVAPPPGHVRLIHGRLANHVCPSKPTPSRPKTRTKYKSTTKVLPFNILVHLDLGHGFRKRRVRELFMPRQCSCGVTEACKPAGQVEAMALQGKLHDGTLLSTVGSCASRPSPCGT